MNPDKTVPGKQSDLSLYDDVCKVGYCNISRWESRQVL